MGVYEIPGPDGQIYTPTEAERAIMELGEARVRANLLRTEGQVLAGQTPPSSTEVTDLAERAKRLAESSNVTLERVKNTER